MKQSATLRMQLFAAACLAVLFSATAGRSENWPQWRGPRHNGVSQEKGLPVQWSKTEGVLWRLSLPGAAGATPVVWGDSIFLTSVDGDNLVAIGANTAGEQMWKRVIGPGGNATVRSDEGNYASPSPCTDGEHVWVCTANGYLACYTVDGKEVWKLNLQDRYGAYDIQFGLSSTPVLDGDRLYLQLIHGEWSAEPAENAFVVALEKATGAEVWKTRRISDALFENKHSYASPTIYRDNEREYLITHGADYAIAYDMKDGGEVWRCGGLNPQGAFYHQTLRFVASPVASDGVVIVPTAKNGPVFCVRADSSGDITQASSALAWKMERGTPDVPSPLVVDGLVYLCGENGNLTCIDQKTGETLYEERTERGRHRASPVYADGKIYLTARNEGIITVVKAGREFEILAKNRMDESITASPAIANGRIYLRTFDALYAIGK